MNKYMNKMKSPQIYISHQPKAAQIPSPQPIHEILHHRPIATAMPTHEDIARRAYQIYVEKGYPQGQSEHIWQQAEQDIQNQGLATFLSR